jgi:hypothetical protein
MVTPQANGCVGMPVSFDLTILDIVPTITPVGPFCEYEEFVTLQATPIGGIFSGPGMVGNDFTPSNAVGIDTIIIRIYT